LIFKTEHVQLVSGTTLPDIAFQASMKKQRWDNLVLVGLWENLRDAIESAAARHRNRPFLEAAMAACAYIALSDGYVSIGERGRIDDILEQLESLRVFDPHEGVNIFNDYVDELNEDPEVGKKAVFAAIAKMSNDKEAALLVARICIAISNADGDFSDSERAAVVEVCDILKTSKNISI